MLVEYRFNFPDFAGNKCISNVFACAWRFCDRFGVFSAICGHIYHKTIVFPMFWLCVLVLQSFRMFLCIFGQFCPEKLFFSTFLPEHGSLAIMSGESRHSAAIFTENCSNLSKTAILVLFGFVMGQDMAISKLFPIFCV